MSEVQEDQTDTLDVDAIVDEAKESFTLIDNIKNRAMRTVKLDLGYDEVNSEKLVNIESALAQLTNILEQAERNGSGIPELKKDVAKHKRDLKKANAEEAGPIQDQLDEAERQIEQRATLLEQIAPMRVKLEEMDTAAGAVRTQVNKESLSVELRALPYAIARGSARRARAALKITQKGIPEDMQEAFEERQLLELAFDQLVRFRDNKTGSSGSKLSIAEIEAIRDFLPLSQSSKFFGAVNDLQFRNAISESAIAQADF